MALKDEFTKNGLTEEEQAIIDEHDGSVNEDEEQENDNNGEAEDLADEEQEVTEEEDSKEDVEESEEPEEQEVSQFVPQYDTGGDELTAIAGQVEELNAKIGELKSQLEDGDLSIEEFVEERDKLADQKTELVARKTVYENNIRNNQLTQDQLWEHDQKVFFERSDNARFKDNPALFGALDANVKIIANEDASAGKTGAWILNEAKRRVLDVFVAKEDDSSKKKAVKPEKKKIPVTLASIPSAEENETSNNEFAYIEKLIDKGDVRGMEVALSKLTAEQQDRFLSQTSA